MQLLKRVLFIVATVSLLMGCATVSEKNYKLAQQNMAKGDFAQAFDRAADALQANIHNHKAIAFFPAVADSAYEQKFSEIEQAKAAGERDSVAYAYDRIISMNRSLSTIQTSLAAYASTVRLTKVKRAAMNRVLALPGFDVTGSREEAYERAAAGHYANADSHAASKSYRQASHEYKQALSFIAGYRDAVLLAAKTKRLADLADAKKSYRQGQQAVRNHQLRAAAQAFVKAESFVHGFRDAHALAAKYKMIADQEDALANYREGERLADEHQYRAAASAFERALSFVPHYRDADALAVHYTDLANREDARRLYRKGERLMDRQDFDQAARAFDQADGFVPGFRNARELAARARSFIAPEHFELRNLVQESVRHGIPLHWLHDVHHGHTEHVKVATIRVIRQGRFNEFREFWPYRLRVSGSCELEISKDNEQQRSFDAVVDYRIFRDDFGDWKATFR